MYSPCTCLPCHALTSWQHKWTPCSITCTVFFRSDAAATIHFAARFVRLLSEGGVYFFGKPGDINDGWIRYVRVRRWRLLDAASSTHSLSVLLSVVVTTRTTQTVLALAWWPSSKIICTHGHVLRLLAVATIQGQRLFRPRAALDCVATIRGRHLFEEIRYMYSGCAYEKENPCNKFKGRIQLKHFLILSQ